MKTAYFKHKGFTTVELIVVVGIIGIMASLAMPSFINLVVSQRVKNTSFELNAAIQYARSEAMKRRADTTIAPATGGWQNGWTITANSLTLKTFAGVSKVGISGPASLVFRKDGRPSSSISSPFILSADPVLDGVASRCIRLDPSGFPKSRLGASC